MSNEAKVVYEDVKRNKSFRYIIYTIRDEKEIIIETKGPRTTTYQDFLLHMKTFKDQCRYILYDYPTYSVDPPIEVDRLLLITWCPDSATVRDKILFASTNNILRDVFSGVYRHVQACDFDELSQKDIEDILVKK